jgi:hypothetical protein
MLLFLFHRKKVLSMDSIFDSKNVCMANEEVFF